MIERLGYFWLTLAGVTIVLGFVWVAPANAWWWSAPEPQNEHLEPIPEEEAWPIELKDPYAGTPYGWEDDSKSEPQPGQEGSAHQCCEH